ncbi:LysR family transcriptional regulator [Kribbella deserti]|uniref:LysR family transcriptional regulator n=1 Tax=Kribbella deserti TaxID=1926257 RepID=A0ABV6QQQ8_9ACTN
MQILRAVVTSGSVTAAATHLGYTPSAISQQIAALEREAGIALLERVGRGVQPTAAGRLLTEHASILSQNVAEAERALADLRAGRTGRLSIRYFASVGPTLLAPALAELRREYDGVAFDLTLTDLEDPLRSMQADDSDLTIMVGTGAASPGIRVVHLVDDSYHAVLPSGHPLAAKNVIEMAELAPEAWIGSEPPGPCLQPILDACAAAGFSPDFVAKSEDHATAQGLVAAGLGISLIPRLALQARHPGVEIRPVRHPEPVRAIHAAVRESTLTQPAARALLDALKAAAKESTQLPRGGADQLR